MPISCQKISIHSWFHQLMLCFCKSSKNQFSFWIRKWKAGDRFWNCARFKPATKTLILSPLGFEMIHRHRQVSLGHAFVCQLCLKAVIYIYSSWNALKQSILTQNFFKSLHFVFCCEFKAKYLLSGHRQASLGFKSKSLQVPC